MPCTDGSRALADLSQIVLDAAHGDKWLHSDWAVFFQAEPMTEDCSESILDLQSGSCWTRQDEDKAQPEHSAGESQPFRSLAVFGSSAAGSHR